ncbi:hypothetical protein VHEMI00505 [[Torrubiella] hemipterigena]|uniref:Inhibitor I9 domain-containing protein n=1 Tax=[Torrubiella] hemipterigena TaxID=1531966 RepID=A0A0A1T2J3_9HYPO|nr:hypothetical protein VHEMI00505 [[Torrubiella] hemipterigena]
MASLAGSATTTTVVRPAPLLASVMRIRHSRSVIAINASSTLPSRHLSFTSASNMPSYIIACNDDASDDQVKAVKQKVIDQGGKIGHEYTIIKGFSAEFDDNHVQTFEAHEHVKYVEKDGVVSTQ